MRPGEEITCPHCGKHSFLRMETLMENWTEKGKVLKCTACGEIVCEYKDPRQTQKESPLKSQGAQSLLSLLGEESFKETPSWKGTEEEKHFCKDCAYLIPHPFVSRCSRTNRTVDPMGDCEDFRRKENL